MVDVPFSSSVEVLTNCVGVVEIVTSQLSTIVKIYQKPDQLAKQNRSIVPAGEQHCVEEIFGTQ